MLMRIRLDPFQYGQPDPGNKKSAKIMENFHIYIYITIYLEIILVLSFKSFLDIFCVDYNQFAKSLISNIVLYNARFDSRIQNVWIKSTLCVCGKEY